MKEKYLNIPYHFSASLHGLFPPNTLVMRAKSVAQTEKKKKEGKAAIQICSFYQYLNTYVNSVLFLFSFSAWTYWWLRSFHFPFTNTCIQAERRTGLAVKFGVVFFFFLNKANLFPTDKISCMFFVCVCVQPQECCIAEELHTKHWLVQDWSNGAPTDWELHGRIREILLHLMV